MRRTGRLLAPSMPVINFTLPGLPPQPSWRMRRRETRSGMARRRLASLSMLSLPQ